MLDFTSNRTPLDDKTKFNQPSKWDNWFHTLFQRGWFPLGGVASTQPNHVQARPAPFQRLLTLVGLPYDEHLLPVQPKDQRFTFTALVVGFSVFKKVEASVRIPDTFSASLAVSPPSGFAAKSPPGDTSAVAVAAAFKFFWTVLRVGTLSTLFFFGVPLPSLLVVFATFFLGIGYHF